MTPPACLFEFFDTIDGGWKKDETTLVLAGFGWGSADGSGEITGVGFGSGGLDGNGYPIGMWTDQEFARECRKRGQF